jgi:hypothetical protein
MVKDEKTSLLKFRIEVDCILIDLINYNHTPFLATEYVHSFIQLF